MASVIHGFIYNKEAFEELGLEEPETVDEFFARARRAQGGRHLHAARHGHGRPVGGRDDGLHQHRPDLLEGRGRPQGADRRHRQVHRPGLCRALRDPRALGRLHGRRLPGAELLGQPEPLHPRPRRDLSRPARGRSAASTTRPIFEMGAFPPPVAGRGRHLLHLGPHRHRHRHERRDAPTPRRRGPSSNGSPRPSSRRSTPTRCPGFFSLSTAEFEVEDPLAQEFISWRERVREHDPRRLPDPVARRAQHLEQHVDGQRQRHEPGARRPRKARRRSRPASRPGTRRNSTLPAPPPQRGGAARAHRIGRTGRDRAATAHDAGPSAARPPSAGQRRDAHLRLPRPRGADLHGLLDLSAGRDPAAQPLRRQDDGSAVWHGLGNYATLLFDPIWATQFWNALWNNLVLFFIHMVVQNPIGLLLAALLSLRRGSAPATAR